MAPSRHDLFDALDDNNIVGVFYFPDTSLSPADQVSALELTIAHLKALREVVEDTKIKAGAAPKFTRLLIWLARFESDLQTEKQKLLDLTGGPPNSMLDSMRTSDAG